ncbi:alkaline phosphatase family protein [Thalassorhabdomicrobium marinisediminis]|uniref:Phosphonate monoester hydrolase n=1 Tax=Thalassorhabdomicrobium marinisediminis TaxID=2170577 RepID=A0A2T7FTH5_9RHOB|nr:alkaline phosphatase family protein [Thalassorhabdomicrobium marinisediminis]PVA05466.1 phosphonate monoester hydrolase [Thalassorhabdomicrobium marinisediminis]
MSPRNILFIMCDQLRFDYLGCTGHPSIRTPHIDALATRGVRFDRAYVQSPICGPSRMSFYTGRYVRSHGSSWNMVPLKVGERTLGEYLRPHGLRTVLCGKTHMTADIEGMQRLGVETSSDIGALLSECGFEVWDRLDGVHPTGGKMPSHYNAYLNEQGYDGENPWEDWANSGEDEDGTILSGWLMQNAGRPARVKLEDSESNYTTTRAMEFIDQAGDDPWCLHLSYIKPHWPYIAPAPYHDMYGAGDVPPAIRSEEELQDPHPLLAAYHAHRTSKCMARDDVREAVIPAYMGLITQIDDQIGVLMAHLEAAGKLDDTLIVFTSDHGDYLGDHWLGEKELFHDPSVRVPLIVVDPDPAADATRGTVNSDLVEAIDLVPTLIEASGGEVPDHILEGHSLMPLLHGAKDWPRGTAVSEYDFAFREARTLLGTEIRDSRAVMVFDGRWKLVHVTGFRPMLFDLETDPQEFRDLGDDPAHAETRDRLGAELLRWTERLRTRTTITDARVDRLTEVEKDEGIWIGFWNEADVARAKKAPKGRS